MGAAVEVAAREVGRGDVVADGAEVARLQRFDAQAADAVAAQHHRHVVFLGAGRGGGGVLDGGGNGGCRSGTGGQQQG
ncbi:hypothetical protein D3C86_1819090 [compost metagenome]